MHVKSSLQVMTYTTIAGGNMRAFLETTKTWTGDVPNHIYYLTDDKSKMVAFYNVNTGKTTKFKKPIGFDTRYRTFKELKRK